MGYEAVDNLPLFLLGGLMENPEMLARPIAIGVDSRTRDFSVAALEQHMARLRALPGIELRLLYLDCSDDILQRRFKETRRRHPLASDRPVIDGIAQERALLDKARSDLAAAETVRNKLTQVLPYYREQEAAFEKLARDGFAGKLMLTDKRRERIEKEQDLRTQEFTIRASEALIEQSEKKIAQISADYRRSLQTERVEVAAQLEASK